jgi:transposase
MTRKGLRCKAFWMDLRPLKNTKLSLLSLSLSEWLSLLKFFEVSKSTTKASRKLYISYKTTLRRFDIICSIIVESLSKSDDILKGEIELDEGKRKRKRSRCADGKTIAFGILERGGIVSVSIVKDVKAESIRVKP